MLPSLSLREVREADLPIFYEQQRDSEALRMAAVPSREYDAFMAHWKKILSDESPIVRTVIFQGEVVGNVVSWEQSGQRKVGYWYGKEYWGKGIASSALAVFLNEMKVRPLYVDAAKHNGGSIRVLQKCGFTICGEGRIPAADGEGAEEFIFTLQSVFEAPTQA